MIKGINTQYLDLTTSPGEDFYVFVNGTWLAKTEIPSDRSLGGSFHELGRETDEKVLAILDNEFDPHPPGAYLAIAAPPNLKSFYEAFEIFPHSPWYRKEEEKNKNLVKNFPFRGTF